jgi:pimeloyl-ACP methyl ester carboxylesterase
MKPLKILYGHGFASGPLSAKGRALRAFLAGAPRGLDVDLLDLRVPSPTGLRLSRMIETALAAIGDAERVLAVGSSLGGLTMAHAAARDPRIVGTVLLAPAFRLVERWKQRMGDADWDAWRARGTWPFDDHAHPGATLDVEFAFMEDAARVDTDWPDVRVPTTIVHGVRDETVDPELSRAFAATRPNVTRVEVDDDHQLLRSLDVIHHQVERAIAALS